MALTYSKIPFFGAYTVDFKTAGSETKSYSNLNQESATMTVETAIGTTTFADGSSKDFIQGRKLTCEFTFDELEEADLDTIEGTDNLLITFDNSKTITVGDTDTYHISTSVDGGKSKVTVTKSVASSGTMANLFTMT